MKRRKAAPLCGILGCLCYGGGDRLMKLSIPEHGLGWTLLVCPIAGLIVAGICAVL